MPATVDAIEELYRSRYASYRGGVAALMGSHDAARDVVQETFAQALRDRQEYRGEGLSRRGSGGLRFGRHCAHGRRAGGS